jgi:hypothetical protein
LTVQVGIANTYLAKGNLPQAQSILDDVLLQATDQQLPDVQAIALHSRAVVSARRGENADGLKLAHDALTLTEKSTERDIILEDIAAMFMQMGMHEPARDAHMILAATAQTRLVKWSATLNLMELASMDGMKDAFHSYARELASAPLGPWVRSHYLLFLGEGLARFGMLAEAEDALREAISYADANQIHQISFKAQSALSAIPTEPIAPRTSVPPTFVSGEVDGVVQAISEMRRAVAAAA